MKTLKKIVTFSFILLSFNIISAQYGGGGMYGGGMGSGGMNRGGMNRNQQSMQNTNNFGKNKSPEELEKERIENLNKSIEKLIKDLSLDDLQAIVIRKEIETGAKSIAVVTKSEVSNEEKIKEVDAINEKTDRTINTYLNTDQKIKYKKYIEERKERMEKYRMSIRN
jgi:hypothetical protein